MKIPHLAGLARLNLTEQETATYNRQLEDILHYMHILDTAVLDDVELDHSDALTGDLTRRDGAKPSLEREDFLQNAPRRNDEQFMVPKVIE